MRWMWIDRILELEPARRIVTIKHVTMTEEHLRGHFPAVSAAPGRAGREAMPVMPASLVIEGVAQSGGILVGHASGFRENIILAKIGRVELARDAIPGDTLRYEVSIERSDRQGVSTVCSVVLQRPGHAPETIGRVDLIFSLLDNSGSVAGLPGGNFVFGAGFRTLLRASGLDPGPPATSR